MPRGEVVKESGERAFAFAEADRVEAGFAQDAVGRERGVEASGDDRGVGGGLDRGDDLLAAQPLARGHRDADQVRAGLAGAGDDVGDGLVMRDAQHLGRVALVAGDGGKEGGAERTYRPFGIGIDFDEYDMHLVLQ